MKRNAFWNWLDQDWRKSGILWLLLLPNLGACFLLFIGRATYKSYDNGFRRNAFICENLIRETIIPKLMERNGLKSCEVIDYWRRWDGPPHMKIETSASRDYESIAKDLVRIHQENWGSGAYVRDGSHLDKQFFLEFDHDAEDMGLTARIFISHPGDK